MSDIHSPCNIRTQKGRVNQGAGGEFINPISNRAKTVFRVWTKILDQANYITNIRKNK